MSSHLSNNRIMDARNANIYPADYTLQSTRIVLAADTDKKAALCPEGRLGDKAPVPGESGQRPVSARALGKGLLAWLGVLAPRFFDSRLFHRLHRVSWCQEPQSPAFLSVLQGLSWVTSGAGAVSTLDFTGVPRRCLALPPSHFQFSSIVSLLLTPTSEGKRDVLCR